MTDNREFIEVIRAAVEADPDNIGLRVDLIELLLADDPEDAAEEIAAIALLGANTQTVQVLRARLAAAQLRQDHGALTTEPEEPPSAIPTDQPADQPADQPRRANPPGFPPASSSLGEAVPLNVEDTEDETPVWDVERPAVTLADVAGLEEVKEHLEAAFLAPLRHPELAAMFGKSPRGSLLMYGPPGCGKTYIARAIAGELGASFVHATLADLVGQYFGQSEKAVHALFETARGSRPCVVFLDEFDALGGRRTSGTSTSHYLRMITAQLLEELDGVASSNEGVYVLAATNRPWDIDPALRRPGRLDRTVLILPPDQPARAAIVRTALKDKPAAAGDDAAIAARTAELSGADLSHAVELAVQAAFMESLRAGVPRMITTDDVERSLRSVVPSTRSWFEQIKPVLDYGIDDGTFGQLRDYLRRHRI